MKITFTRQELLAAMLFASSDDSRYILNGVCLKYRPGKKPIAIATDGRRLCVIESMAEQEDAPESNATECEIVLSSSFLKPVCALNKALDSSEGKIFSLITFENKPGSERVMVNVLMGMTWLESEKGAIIEGKFPNWQTVVPPKNQKREPVSNLGMNAGYVGDFAKAAKLFNRDLPQIQLAITGKDKVIEIAIPGVPNFYGIFMPVKADDTTEFQPEFLGIVEGLPKKPEEENEQQPA